LTLEVYFRNVSLYMLVYGSESLYMTDKMFIGDVLVYLANFGFNLNEKNTELPKKFAYLDTWIWIL
jgi:predicted AlkP superfamily phosphohydrolase/phosphomutase